MILGQFKMGEHQAKCRSLVTIDQLVDDASLDLGCHHLDLRHTWYQQYRHYRPHARTVSTPLANFCNNRQTQPPVACYLVICQH